MEKLVEFWDHAQVLSDLLQEPLNSLAQLSPGLWHASLRQMKAFRERFEAMDPTTMTQEEMEAQKVVERDEMRAVLTNLRSAEERLVQEQLVRDANENAAAMGALPPDSDEFGEEEAFVDVELP